MWKLQNLLHLKHTVNTPLQCVLDVVFFQEAVSAGGADGGEDELQLEGAANAGNGAPQPTQMLAREANAMTVMEPHTVVSDKLRPPVGPGGGAERLLGAMGFTWVQIMGASTGSQNKGMVKLLPWRLNGEDQAENAKVYVGVRPPRPKRRSPVKDCAIKRVLGTVIKRFGQLSQLQLSVDVLPAEGMEIEQGPATLLVYVEAVPADAGGDGDEVMGVQQQGQQPQPARRALHSAARADPRSLSRQQQQ